MPPPVLHLTTRRSWRGGERQVMQLARELEKLGVAQHVAAPRGSSLLERLQGHQIALHALHPRLALHPINLVRLWSVLRTHAALVVHTHCSKGLSLASLLRRLAPCAGVVHTRRVAFAVRRSPKYRRAADRYVAISHAVAEQLRGVGVPDSRLRVIPSAVDLASIDSTPLLPTPSWPTSAPSVGCVAALEPEKGLEVLLDAWQIIAAALPNARLVLIGEGRLRAKLARRAATLPRGSVLLAGFVGEVVPWLKRCSLYVQPSLEEGLGSSVLEAMGCGLAVVASDTGGLPEVVERGETGLLVPPGDAAALAEALLALLADEQRRHAMGRAGRARAERHFTIQTMARSYLAVYREVAGNQRSDR